jgi:hypothetical protein
MKKLFFTFSIFTAGFATQAQELATDQNPNYKVSMDKYASTQVGLQATNNTTIQDTYKAYDFSEAKAARQAERRNFRRERRLFNSYNNSWNNGWDNNWNNNGWNNSNGRFNNNYYSPFGNGRNRNNFCWRW